MEHTLNCMEKMDKLLEEAEEYIKCAGETEDSDLRSAYKDLARCHYDGYENLRRCAEHMVDKKAHSHPEGQTIKKMADWHMDKYQDKASKIKHKMDSYR